MRTKNKKNSVQLTDLGKTFSLGIKSIAGLECSTLHEDTPMLSKQGPGILLLMGQRIPMFAFEHKVLSEHGYGCLLA